jgi:hypothetical protein
MYKLCKPVCWLLVSGLSSLGSVSRLQSTRVAEDLSYHRRNERELHVILNLGSWTVAAYRWMYEKVNQNNEHTYYEESEKWYS